MKLKLHHKIIIAVVIIVALYIILRYVFKKKTVVLNVTPDETQMSLSDDQVTNYVQELYNVINKGFFVPVDFASVYDSVSNNSDYDVIRIANEYAITFDANLKDEIIDEWYWIGSRDLAAAQRLSKRLENLGF